MGLRQVAWWRLSGFPSPEEWSALWAGTTFLVAAVAAIIALGQLHAHFQTERARARPYVIVDFAFSSVLMRVEVRNISSAAATGIDLRVDPPFESTRTEDAATLNSVFSADERISMLAPGRRIQHTLDRAPDYHMAKLPQKYTVTLTYGELPARFRRRALDWWRRSEVRYQEQYVLDFRQWSRAAAETDYDNMNWNIASRQERRTESMMKALSRIAESVQRPASDAQARMVVAEDVALRSELTEEYALETPVESAETPDMSAGKDLAASDDIADDATRESLDEAGEAMTETLSAPSGPRQEREDRSG